MTLKASIDDPKKRSLIFLNFKLGKNNFNLKHWSIPLYIARLVFLVEDLLDSMNTLIHVFIIYS